MPRLVVEVEDGHRYVSEREGPWDVIVVDAFYADAIPFHLATWLELARSRLTPGGLVVTNIIGAERAFGLTPLPLDASHLPCGLPDRRDSPCGRSGQRHRVGSQHHRRGR